MFRRLLIISSGSETFSIGRASSLALSSYTMSRLTSANSSRTFTTAARTAAIFKDSKSRNSSLWMSLRGTQSVFPTFDHQIRCFGTSSVFLQAKAKTSSSSSNSSASGVADPFSTNLYQRLGISKTASESEIKHAFHRLAKQYHPDANPGDSEAQEKFVHIKEAKNILGNQAKRKIYDETGSQKEADDPRLHRARSLLRTWIPIAFVAISIVGFLVNSKIIRPARKSSNLYLRYFINWLGILLLLYVFPNKLLATSLLVYSHAGFYRHDMAADVTDHIAFRVDRRRKAEDEGKKKKKNSDGGEVIFIEVVPEDQEARDSLSEMTLTVISRDGKTSRIIEPQNKEAAAGGSGGPRFLVQVPVEDFSETKEEGEKAARSSPSTSEEDEFNRYVRVICSAGGNSFELMDKKILLPDRS